MRYTFLHTADIHLDSPLKGLERYDGAPVEEVRTAARRALVKLVDHAIQEHVAFILIAGDVYDGDWRDYNTGLFFASQMTRLREAKIPAYLISGNHDAASQISRSLRLPDNVHCFSTEAPQTVTLNDLGVAIHGQGFASARVDRDLAEGYPAALPQHFNIGLLHTSLDGRPGHAAYAPCSLKGLIEKGYDYWALGHVHQREVVQEDPWIVFPGNIQGRHIRESGPKGCTIVTVDNGGIIATETVFVDVLRWAELSVDVSQCEHADEVIDKVTTSLSEACTEDSLRGRTLAVRLSLTGGTSAHTDFMRDPVRWTNEIRRCGTDIGLGRVWVEKVIFKTHTPIDLCDLAAREDALSELLRQIETLTNDESALAALVASELTPMIERVNRDLDTTQETQRYAQPEEQRTLLIEARDLLVTRLISGDRNP